MNKELTYEDIEARVNELLAKRERLLRERQVSELRRIPAAYDKKKGYTWSKAQLKLRDVPIIQDDIERVSKELENLDLQAYSTPKITKCGTVKADIKGRWEYSLTDGKVTYSIKLRREYNKWYSPEDLDSGVHTIIETDKDNIPVLIKRQYRNSDTKGYLTEYDYPVILEVLPTESILPIESKSLESIKQSPRDSTIKDTILDVNEVKTYSVDQQLETILCPRCKVEITKGVLARYHICSNCGLVESEIYEKLRQNESIERYKKGVEGYIEKEHKTNEESYDKWYESYHRKKREK
jgi:hypothetical protein